MDTQSSSTLTVPTTGSQSLLVLVRSMDAHNSSSLGAANPAASLHVRRASAAGLHAVLSLPQPVVTVPALSFSTMAGK